MKKRVLITFFLMLLGFSFAQQPNHWTTITGTQFNLTMNGVVSINGVEQTSSMLEVGAFCGDECRGSALAQLFPPTGQYIVCLAVVSNQQSGENITFRLYDHSTQQEFPSECVNSITFNSNVNIGSLGNWYPFAFVSTTSYTLDIIGYGSQSGGYYLIAPPFDDIDPAEVEGMTPEEEEGDFDLYYFDQSQDLEWINYKGDNGNFKLQSGKGYLYARENGTTLTFTTTEPYNGNGEVELVYSSEAVDFPGWNLIGNPWGQTAYLADGRSFYVMNGAHNEIIPANSNAISAMQGVFVVTTNTAGETVTFTTTEPAGSKNQLVLNVTKDRGALVDRVIVRFDSDATLGKMMLNPANTKVYVPMDGKDYAVVGRDAQGQTPVCFKANQNGSYTISVDVEGLALACLHLIDHLTGKEIDLLQCPIYTFEAKTSDYANRFELLYSVSNGVEEHQDEFAYGNGSQWFVKNTGDALLQVVDLNGRVVYAETIRGNAEVQVNAVPGVYVMHLISDGNDRNQKIVIQ